MVIITTTIPISVTRIIRRVQSLTRSYSFRETAEDGDEGHDWMLARSKVPSGLGKVRRTMSLTRMDSLPADVPAGCLPVYVGDSRKRFVISMKYLSHPLFKAVLKRSEEEFGFNHQGGLTIACDPAIFERLLQIITSDETAAQKDAQLEMLLGVNAWGELLF